MASKNNFVDYYDLMQISPKAEIETIRRVYKLLVSQWHPDNSSTGNPEKFLLLREAFEVLSNPDRRMAYDGRHTDHLRQALPSVDPARFAKGIDAEAGRRLAILSLLYHQRMTDSARQGLSLLDLQQMTQCDAERIGFTTWYLQNKNFLDTSDNSDFVITTTGIDYLEANMPAGERDSQPLLDASPQSDGD